MKRETTKILKSSFVSLFFISSFNLAIAAPEQKLALAEELKTNPPSAAQLANGEKIFKVTCSVCHGEKGNGAVWGKLNPRPRNFTSAESYAKMTRERMIRSVTFGRGGTAMQPFGKQLTPAEIEAVVDYIRVKFIATGQPSDMNLPFANGMKGDKVNGGVLYHANCTPCHGPQGDGQGRRAYFINPKPRNFLLPESRRWLNRPILHDIITQGRPGTDMPAWGKIFNPQEVADIAEYVSTQFIKPVPLNKK